MEKSQESHLGTSKRVWISPSADVGAVSLNTANLPRLRTFYNEVIGFQILREDGNRVVLGAGSRPILILEEVPGAKSPPPNATGLYHSAIRFPDRQALAVKVAQLASMHYQFGYADHLVSEAFYLSDPDGNGLELYRDRPREEWQWKNGEVAMASDPIDFDSFFDEIRSSNQTLADTAAPAGTKLGHIHLRVADIPAAEKFYHGVLGFDVTARMPGALFLSAGGYHHHLGMNTWESRGGRHPATPSTGLREFSIILPDQTELGRLVRQIETAGVPVERGDGAVLLADPFDNPIRILLEEQLSQDA